MAILTFRQPRYDGVKRTLKQLSNARRRALYRIEAIDLVAATLMKLTAHRSFDGLCELLDLINAAAERNSKFGDALDTCSTSNAEE